MKNLELFNKKMYDAVNKYAKECHLCVVEIHLNGLKNDIEVFDEKTQTVHTFRFKNPSLNK